MRRYPDEVAALLLVDSAHPPITWWTTAVRVWMYRTPGREFRGLDETGQEVLREPPFAGRPVTVLNAGMDPTASGHELSEREALRVDLFRLNPSVQAPVGRLGPLHSARSAAGRHRRHSRARRRRQAAVSLR